MTRKHFNALASALHKIRPTDNSHPLRCDHTDGRYDRWFEAVSSVADVCESSNPRFSRSKFQMACDSGS